MSKMDKTPIEEAYPPKIWQTGVGFILMGFSFACGFTLLYLCGFGTYEYELLIKTCVISVGLLGVLGVIIIFADVTTQGEQK